MRTSVVAVLLALSLGRRDQCALAQVKPELLVSSGRP